MPWQKGKSGNPNGRPRDEDSIATAMREFLKENAVDANGKSLGMTHKELFVRAIFKSAAAGNARAAQLLWNHIDGMPLQKLKHSGDEDGEPIGIQIYTPKKKDGK